MNIDHPSASPATAGGTYATPPISYGGSITPAPGSTSLLGPLASPPQKSLAGFIADLQRSLGDRFDAAAHKRHSTVSTQPQRYDGTFIHPLTISSSNAGPSSAGTLQLPWELLTSALSRFEYQVLNASTFSAVHAADPLHLSQSPHITDKDRIRLLALLRENSQLNLADIATSNGVHKSKKIVERRKSYKTGFPGSSFDKLDVKSILESIARDAGWETFQGADDDADGCGTDANSMQLDGGQSSNGANMPKTQTITMAGKGIVLDIDFDAPAQSHSDKEEAISLSSVTAARFSYGVEGSTDTGVDKLLSRQAKARDWERLRSSLLALSRLDDVIALQESMSQDDHGLVGSGGGDTTSASELDPFSAMKKLTIKAEEIFKAELEVASSGSQLFSMGHGLVLEHHTIPYAQLFYYMPAYVFNTQTWEDTEQSGFQSDQLATLAILPNVRTISFGVSKSQPSGDLLSSSLLFSQEHSSTDAHLQIQKSSFPLLPSPPSALTEKLASGLQYVARLDTSIYIPAACGRRLQDILQGTNMSISYSATQLHMFTLPGQTPHQFIQEPNVPATIEQLVLPHVHMGVSYNLNIEDLESQLPPLRAKLQPSVISPAFQLETFTFDTIDQLLAVVEVLRVQHSYADLLANLFDKCERVEHEVDPESSISLEKLFSDDPLPEVNITVQTDADSSWPPRLQLSFVLSRLPSWLPVTLTLSISPSGTKSSGYEVQCQCNCSLSASVHQGKQHASGPDIASRIEHVLGIASTGEMKGITSMESILAISGNPRMLVRWVCQRLDAERARQGNLHALWQV